MQFTWDCAITNQRTVSTSPQLEIVSSLYNFAVAQMKEAWYTPPYGDGIKIASKYFQQSAWVFNYLLT